MLMPGQTLNIVRTDLQIEPRKSQHLQVIMTIIGSLRIGLTLYRQLGRGMALITRERLVVIIQLLQDIKYLPTIDTAVVLTNYITTRRRIIDIPLATRPLVLPLWILLVVLV